MPSGRVLERQDVLRLATPGGVFLLNTPYGPDEVFDELARLVQRQIIDKRLRFFVIDASKVAREVGLPGRTNTILQTCFFAISGVLPREAAIRHIEIDPQDLRSQGRDGGRQELRCGRRYACAPLPGRGAGDGQQ